MRFIKSIGGSMKRMSFHGSRKELSDCIVDKAKDYIQNNTSHHPGASSLTSWRTLGRSCTKLVNQYPGTIIDIIFG